MTRALGWLLAPAAILLIGAVPAAAAGAVLPPIPPTSTQSSGEKPTRLRTTHPAIRAAFELGVERSPTFRRLLESLETTDGMVYVDDGVCRYGVRACLWSTVTVAGPFRLLRVSVDLRKGRGCTLVGFIGHELQHALEVLADPNLRDDTAIANFFERTARTSTGGLFETATALDTGDATQHEVCRFPRELRVPSAVQ